MIQNYLIIEKSEILWHIMKINKLKTAIAREECENCE